MSLPKPPVSLDGGCSIINDKTLYVYTPSALLSLPLEKDAKWKPLAMGESVTGGVCVNGPDGLYILGGSASTPEYTGLQRYSFREDEWHTIQFAGSEGDLKSRVHHGAVYLEDADAFFVYAGVQDGSDGASTATFMVSASEPYTIQSFPPTGDLAAVDPTLVAWDGQTAALVGASSGRNQVWTFGNGQWTNTGASIGQELPDKSKAGSALLNRPDGSKILQIFDMSVSPNAVTSWALLEDGQPVAAPGRQVGQADSSNASIEERDLGASDYPAYEGRYAGPVRTLFSVAQDDRQLVAFVGGNDDTPVALFDQAKNAWLDPSQVFLGTTATATTQTSSSTSTSSSSSASETHATSTLPAHWHSQTHSQTPAASSSAPADAGDKSHGPSSSLIIGATVGAVAGLVALILLILLLCCLRKRKARGAAQTGMQEKRPETADPGTQPLHLHPGPLGQSRPRTASAASSLAIMAGKGLMTGRAAGAGAPAASPLRTMSVADDENSGTTTAAGFSNAIGAPGGRLTDENWGKYFANADDGDSRKSGLSDVTAADADDNRIAACDTTNLPHIQPIDVSNVKFGRVEESPVTERRTSMIPTSLQQQGSSAQFDSTEGEWDDQSRLSAGWGPRGLEDRSSEAWRTSRIASSMYSEGFGASRDSQWRRSSYVGSGGTGTDGSMSSPPHISPDSPAAGDTSHITTWSEVNKGVTGQTSQPHTTRQHVMQLPDIQVGGRPLTHLMETPGWPTLDEADEDRNRIADTSHQRQDYSWIDLGSGSRPF